MPTSDGQFECAHALRKAAAPLEVPSRLAAALDDDSGEDQASLRHPLDTPFVCPDAQHRYRSEGVGATIMGRNMFGPIRGEWGDSDWNGGWGGPAVPPSGFVLITTLTTQSRCRAARLSLCHRRIESGYAQAKTACGARLSPEGHRVPGRRSRRRCRRGRSSSHPVILGSGERLIDGFEAGKPALELVRVLHAPGVAHLRYRGRPVTQWVIPRVN